MATVSMEAFLLHLIDKAEEARSDINRKKSMREELRTLEFWRAIIAECLATFFYVFLVCGSHVTWPHHPTSTLTKAFTNGFAMATLAQCFGHISGAHVNPAFTFAMLVTQRITPLRAFLYITAQCGGAIAGAALLYGVTIPGHQEALGSTIVHESLSPWQAFGVEFVLTFVIVFTMYATTDPNRKSLGSDALAVGIAYLACTLTGLPASGASMNPARSLGPAFVMNRWTNHWVYWFGPVAGGLLAGLIYEYIFDSNKRVIRVLKDPGDDADRDSHIDEDYEDGDSKGSKYAAGPTSQVPQPAQQQQQVPQGPYQRPQPPYDGYRQQANTYTPAPGTNYATLPEGAYVAQNAPAGNYTASVYGPRYSSISRGAPSRMEYGSPGASKF